MELKETHQYRYGNIFNTFEPWVHPHTPEFAYRLAVVRGLNSHGGLYF